MIPIDCFEEPWVIFRGKDGKPGCVQNTCAHRACPLHLGSVKEGSSNVLIMDGNIQQKENVRKCHQQNF
ncbi:hypothetical protein HAX54_030736 [Datura stramonium]|uniref:Rieske domain-containing protein n=1 Tax=Datura stramonium TaxID=4076 RepID=A0ABS8V925_DATST|nr:hypothetical protein [Datura stramonium]